MKRVTIALALVLAGACSLAACGSGDVGDTTASKPVAPGPPQAVAGGEGGTDCIPPACQVFPLLPSQHAVRLTSPDWERTMRDLLRLDAVPGNSVDFPPDAVASADRFGSEAGDLIVTTQQWAAYQKAAESLSLQMVSVDAALQNILPAGAKDNTVDTPTRIAAFVADFLPKAYRRPVTAAEIAAIIATGETAAASDATLDPFLIRVKWILTAVLQSPKLLYRISFGEGEIKDGRRRLSGYEVAQKLSYGLWGTMPDDALIAQAKAGKLSTTAGIAAVATTMADDARAEFSLSDFHDQLYLINHFTDNPLRRDTDTFPAFYPDFMVNSQEDLRRSIKDIVITNRGGVKELHTSTVAYVNLGLAPIYGVDPSTIPELAAAGSNDVYARVDMDPAKRTGILMHPGWLAYEGTPRDPSIIHRGAFIARHVVCAELGAPLPGAGNAKIDTTQPTNRKRIEATTGTCGIGCHTRVINPLGSAFEGFDSIGMVRATDFGQPLDTTGKIDILAMPYADAVSLFKETSTSTYAHACYAAHWASYLNGTSYIDVTPKWLSPTVAKSLKGASVREIIVELVQTDAFLTVSASQ